MKKSMINMLLWIIAIIFCINGCVMDNFKEDIGIGKDNKTEKAYLSLSLNESRTVLPQSLDRTKLRYTLVGRYNEENHQLGEWTYSEMTSSQTELSVGQWNFTLTANDGTQDVLVGNINNCTIKGGNNPLSFTMKECSTGTGVISVTIKMPHGKVAKVEAVLRDLSDITSDSQTLSVSVCTDDPTLDYALYEFDSAPKGLYTLLLSLYQSASDTESINEQIMLVRVEPGCLSAGTVVFEQVNTYWHITYHFEDFDVTDDPVLVTKYNESMRIILPNTYQSKNGDNYYITGNYNNEDGSGDKVSVIDYDNSGDIVLWVNSMRMFSVTSSGLSALLDTLNSADSPYYIELTDNSPDLSDVKSALTDHSDIKVYLDMKECNELTSITEKALQVCSSLTGIVIPDSVTSIDNYAFSNCSGLTSVTIPDSVTSIGSEVFYGCNSLTSIEIPNSVMSIGNRAFYNCSELTSLIIEAAIPPNLSSNVFKGCTCAIYVPNDVVSDYRVATGWSGYAKMIHPISEKDVVHDDETVTKSVSELSSYLSDLEYYGQIVNVTISDINPSLSDIKTLLNTYPYKINLDLSQCLNLTSIGSYAFSGCSGLTSVTIPDSVTSIGNNAFNGCSGLTSVTIPDSVTSIATAAFSNCSGLTSVTIPDSVTSIGNSAFSYCSGLTSVTIPDSVTNIGKSAFSYCSSLTSMSVDENNTYDSRNNCNAIIETATNTLIAGCKNTVIPNTVTSIGSSAFNGCSGLTSVTIPDSVTSIGEYAFAHCSGLTSVTIPNSVTSIDNQTFYECSGLTSVTIPNSVTSIGTQAFSFCSSLTSVTIPDSVTSINGYAFQSCIGLTSMSVDVNNAIYDSRNDCNAIIETATNTLIAGCKNTVIPNTVTSIGSYAFNGCSSLTSVTIPDSVTSIGKYAFSNCSSLTSVTIPDSVTSIDVCAFQSCSGLTSVTIPDSVTSINGYAFQSCSGLMTLNVKATKPPSFGSNMLYNCSALTTIYVPTASVDTYKATSGWSGFADKIEGKEF